MADVQPSTMPQSAQPLVNSADEQKPAAVTNENAAKQDESDSKEEEYKMPENASETLYLQNLNETVRVDCECLHSWSLFVPVR